MERSDDVLSVSSLIVAVLAFSAGFVLVYASVRLAADFDLPGVSRTQTGIAMAVVLGLAVLCFLRPIGLELFGYLRKSDVDISRDSDCAK